MFYGTINSNGTIHTASAHSNNFSVKGKGSGQFVVTFNEYMYYEPNFVVTAISNNSGKGHAVNAEWYMSSSDENQPFQATVITSRVDQQANDYSFTFRARTGQSRIFAATTLTLTPKVITFQDTEVLVLTTTIGGETLYLDKGTVLIGVGTRMTLRLGASSVVHEGTTWDLTGWTYGGGSGPNGASWSDGTFQLETDPAGSGPTTTPYLFAIKGVRSSGTGQQNISTDPVVRLSSVPPGGISL